MDGWRLLSAEERHAAAPESFFIPPRAKRETLRIGDSVKLLFEGPSRLGGEVVERMWVEVTAVSSEAYTGRLLNKPSEVYSIHEGDLVSFFPEHVAAYEWPPEELGYDAGQWAWVRTESSVPRGRRPERVSMRPEDLRADDSDSGWIVGRGDETAAEYDNQELFRWGELGWLADLYPELETVFRAGAGVWRWDETSKQYVRVHQTSDDLIR